MAYSKNQIDKLFKRIVTNIVIEKASLRSTLALKDMPSNETFYKWLQDDKNKTKQYARACTLRADAIFDEMLDIADDGTNDYMTNKHGEKTLNNEHIQRSKLRIDARKWSLSKMNPKKYGDKLDVTTGDKSLNKRPSFVFINKSNESTD